MEIEIRSLIEPEKFRDLMNFFAENGKLLGVNNEETYYFDGDKDIRIQKSDSGGKIWYKSGKMHDEAREEIEVHFDRSDFSKMLNILKQIGLKEKIKWFRVRHKIQWQDVLVFMDYTLGYGHIIELEAQGEEKDKEKVLQKLRHLMSLLDVPITPREEFEKKFKYYEKNWKTLLS